MAMITPHDLEEAVGHLGAAISQSASTDDQIIMEHVRAAHALLRDAFRAHLATAHRLPEQVQA